MDALEFLARLAAFRGYTVNTVMMARADKRAIFLHCLPAHRGEEVTTDVLDGPQSRVWDEAENRLRAQKAVMAVLMGGETLTKPVARRATPSRKPASARRPAAKQVRPAAKKRR